MTSIQLPDTIDEALRVRAQAQEMTALADRRDREIAAQTAERERRLLQEQAAQANEQER